MIESLKKIGLSENEAKAYVALLEMGHGTAQQIAQKASINRPTAYVQLETLMRMGLISSFEKESANKDGATKTLFRIEDPSYLKKFIESERRVFADREHELTAILPDLEKIFIGIGSRPRVRFFDGAEGLKTIQDEFLKTTDRLVESAASLDDVLNIFPTHPEDYAPRRVKRGIHSKLLYTTSRGPFLKSTDKTMLRESRFVPPEHFAFSSDMAIYGNSIALSVLRDQPYGVIIESREVANSMRALFNLAWDQARKYN